MPNTILDAIGKRELRTQTLQMKITPTLNARIKEEAKARDMSMKDLINTVLEMVFLEEVPQSSQDDLEFLTEASKDDVAVDDGTVEED